MLLTAEYSLQFASPWWLLAALLAIPLAWLGIRNLGPLGRFRQAVVIVLRSATVLLLAALLAQPAIHRRHEQLSLVVVIDRSQSMPEQTTRAIIEQLERAAPHRRPGDLLAVVDVAEAAAVAVQPGPEHRVPQRSPSLDGSASRLSAGIQMAMAIISPQAAGRILLISDGNQNSGDLHEAARIAAANRVPLDVLPVQFRHRQEVAMERLVAPSRARSGQTVALRFVLNSTAPASGRLMLSLNGQPVRLNPAGDDIAVPVELAPGINVRTVSIPLGASGLHEFKAAFIPDDDRQDTLNQNNVATAATFVAGPGVILVVEPGDESTSAENLVSALDQARMAVRRISADQFPQQLTRLMDVDSIALVNVDSSLLLHAQQQMIVRYVRDLGGGLVMVGGPNSFGAGGWIDTPVAELLPVDLDPPQKKQMPPGHLVLVIDRSGSMAGQKLEMCKRAAIGATWTLSRLDHVGVVMFDTVAEWTVPLQPADDKQAIESKIRAVPLGGGTDIYPGLEQAHKALLGRKGVRHVILLTDGMSAGPDCRPLAAMMKKDGITVSTVAVGADADRNLLVDIARITDGRFYVAVQPQQVPQIFIKEAQVVRRSLIQEKSFVPLLVSPISELVSGREGMPGLDGYVLTGAKAGLAQVVLASPDRDPILAVAPAGLGRVVAFTSTADSRWAGGWLNWGGYARFWEQAVRWSSRTGRSTDCEIFAEVQGRDVLVTVESAEGVGGPGVAEGSETRAAISDLAGQVIDPDISARPLHFQQVGPGQFRAQFRAEIGGSYLINVSFSKGDSGRGAVQAVAIVPFAPEFADTRDNRELLAEVADIAGGRVLSAEAIAADPAGMFGRDGVAFPSTSQALTMPLMLAWIVLFLLDVATRRIAIDFRRLTRSVVTRLVGVVRRKRLADDSTLARLATRRQQVRKTLTASQKQIGQRRYVPPQDAPDINDILPDSDSPLPGSAGMKPATNGSAGLPPATPPADDTTMDRLLRSKRDRKK